jgi:PadR family transcriptional regulator, regulatory protein AphA
VMTLVGQGGAGPHDLVRMARSGRIYWDAAESQFYAEPKRLAQLGLLEAQTTPGKTRERTHYTLTDAGRAALREWLATPAHFARIQNEAIVRVLASEYADRADVLAGLAPLRTEIAGLLGRLDEVREIPPELRHRERALTLNQRLARRILEAHLAWLDEVEREL